MPNVVDYFVSSSRFDTGEILFKLSKDATPHSYFNAHLQIVKIEVSLVPVPYILNTYLIIIIIIKNSYIALPSHRSSGRFTNAF